MRAPAEIAAKFAAIDAHDDTVEEFVIHPPIGRRKQAAVEVTLFRHWQNKRRVIRFSNCANIALAMDADVLANNWPINTHSLVATADLTEITTLMRRQSDPGTCATTRASTHCRPSSSQPSSMSCFA